MLSGATASATPATPVIQGIAGSCSAINVIGFSRADFPAVDKTSSPNFVAAPGNDSNLFLKRFNHPAVSGFWDFRLEKKRDTAALFKLACPGISCIIFVLGYVAPIRFPATFPAYKPASLSGMIPVVGSVKYSIVSPPIAPKILPTTSPVVAAAAFTSGGPGTLRPACNPAKPPALVVVP